ncbi:ASPIC/UnbV domain protein [Gemmatirosa kalamazoonensis]|uniref:ASPIC/UnbV domain protein n=1 Tax=Gemmatirosa kalamazoonensis TaxID=861299 RepID=W0RG40_9BACT|nr:FG-GAP-like repeat-containing protein [Gemmatirosa kalamazoonensis]AHG89290.1 ASPIC/UnbV domain protein [Gemmatirosa kalamazoonensis]
MKRSTSRIASAVLATVVVASCHRDSAPRPWHQMQGYRWRELVVDDGGKPGFTEMSARETGIRFENDVPDSVLLGNRMLAQGGGVALGDVDGDGRPDVFLARSSGCSALYRNLGDWKFDDVTQRAGVGACGRHASGAAFADIDGDGDLDLVLLATTGPNAIFVNDGRGHFTEHRDLGLDPAGKGGTTVALADVDGDGRLDMYVANYKPYSPVDTLAPQERAPSQLVHQVGPNAYAVVPERQKDFKLVMRPDMGGMNVTMRGEPDDLYLNRGGRFERVPLGGGDESFGLSAKLVDLTGDGAPELYVANDFEDTDQLWINDGHGNFHLADWTAQRQTSNSAMGVDVADVNGDGLPDLFETDMLSDDTRRLKTQMPAHTALPKRVGDVTTQLQQQRNTLFVNRGDGTFAEVAALAGVQATGWSWGTMFLDVDLDGRPDLLVANGHLWDIMDADVQERLQNRVSGVTWQRERWEFPKLALHNVAFRNRGDLTFENASVAWHFGTEADVSHALAAADLDGDGDLDVVVNRLRAPALVLRSDAAAPRIAVRLRGTAPNTQAVGARITLRGGAVPLQTREVQAGGLYLSHSDYEASFAMGTSQRATLEIVWRDGRRTRVENVAPNRLYEVDEASVERGAGSVERSDDSTLHAPRSTLAPLFEDGSAQLGGHVHTENTFDDWERQFLLPNALSQLGPGVAWFDVDRDGDEDLVVGAGKGGAIAVFRNDGGRLVPMRAGAPTSSDLTTVLGVADASGTRILAGVASWEGGTPPSVVSVGARGGTPQTVVPPLPSSTGPIALGDYDGDGDLDLFVGGRAVPGAYPAPASSSLWRNEGGRFVLDTLRSAPLDHIGLVSAASFADVDGDGDADLLLAREWGSIELLLNQGGRFFTAAAWGLERWPSRWNGLATGDLDGDGRLDIVATSWGRNTMTPADRARPLVMLHGPFGSGGEEEMLVARDDPRLHGLAPLNGYARLRVALPDLGRRLGTFAAYADATVDSVLGGGPRAARVHRDTVVTLDHMAFLNRGDHFEPMALPTEAQMAPAFYAGIADFDGDGKEDVFLSQNFYPTAVGLPRYDAGRGLLLLGDGKGGLAAVPGSRSGIRIYGDQRGAAYADYDRDGRLDLVVSQNGAATVLLHNRGARPGLRVILRGPATNPDGVGAQIRVVYGERMGPVREVQAGSGYWSQNGAAQVFGLDGTPTAVQVRWPGGVNVRVPVPNGAREVVVRREP